MAAIDPSAKPEHTGTADGDAPVRATLKMIYDPSGPGDEEEDSEGSDDEDAYLKALLEGRDSEDEEDDDESSSDDEEKNGGPSDPSKTKRARKEAAMKELMDALAEQNESDDEMDVDVSAGANGITTKSKADKGKAKALPGDSKEEDSEEDSDDSLDGMEELVVCTLDPEKVARNPSSLWSIRISY
jgi:FK506-binding nuclear protein